MNIHEFQAKEILQFYNVETPSFKVVDSLSAAVQVLDECGIQSGVVKVQVHAGSRGKAGGIRICQSKEEILEAVSCLLGMEFRSEQTGGEVLIVEKVLISKLVSIVKEYYVAILIDKKHAEGILMVSPEGGVDIEEVACRNPEKILKIPITHYGKIYDYLLRNCCHFLGMPQSVFLNAISLLKTLVKVFYENDASLLEINPLVLTEEGKLSVLDAKIILDDNALYRHSKLSSYEGHQLNSRELIAKKSGLSYVSLDGNIGCLVNGAGLAMATLDVLRYQGLAAANFLDIGGSASETQIREAIYLLLSDTRIHVIFVNVFGGIMDCSVLARGIVSALEEKGLKSLSIVLRLEGTNVDLGKEILESSSIAFTFVKSMEEGAKMCKTLSDKRES